MTKNKITYKEAFTRLQEIVNTIENSESDIDKLSDLVKEASSLIKDCKAKLKSTEDAVNKSIEDLEKENKAQ